jgi:hypothetical protein
MKTGELEIFDAPHNDCPTLFSPDDPSVRRNSDGTFSVRRRHLIPTKPIGSGETTYADNLWLDENKHWNTEDNRATFPTEESAQTRWEQFCETNSA